MNCSTILTWSAGYSPSAKIRPSRHQTRPSCNFHVTYNKQTEQTTFYILLTVHPGIIMGKWPTWSTITLYKTSIIVILYMFRATLCSSSGGPINTVSDIVFSVSDRPVCRFLLNLHTGQSLTDSTIPDTVLTFWRRNYFFKILAHSVYKMWIKQEPNTIELWNNCILKGGKKRRVYTMFKIFSTYMCWINI